MARQDYAILVGISRYADETFARLDGPPHDVDLMRAWLERKTGGDVPRGNIIAVTSPAKIPDGLDPNDWTPQEADFNRAFRGLVEDRENRTFIRRPGRLYLYFSGHGFSERKGAASRAALYTAPATRNFPGNIYGTGYANAAKEQALFSEIVLVMDCCRDSELNLPFAEPSINSGTAAQAAAVRMMALYAAPKGGKAQERAIPERNGLTYGLLTHAFLKALEEAVPDTPIGISSTALKKYMQSIWPAVCGDVPADEPEFLTPSAADIIFPAAAAGVLHGFRLVGTYGSAVTIDIRDAPRNLIATCVVNGATATLTVPGQPAVPLALNQGRFEIRLQPGLYRCEVSGGVAKVILFEADGVKDVEI